MDLAHPRRGVLTEPAAASFVEFYRREWRDVVGLGFVLTGNRCVAEDSAQEGFAAAYRRWDQVAAMDKPGAWVRRVVVNQSMSWFRRRGAERRALARVGNPRESSLDLDAQVTELWAAVRKLPRRQRQAIALPEPDLQGRWRPSRDGCEREPAGGGGGLQRHAVRHNGRIR